MEIIPSAHRSTEHYFFDLPKYYDAVESCFECATSCWISADALISERDLKSLLPSIDFCLSCAEICTTTARVLLTHYQRDPAELRMQLEKCIQACEQCIKECGGNCDHHEHGWICVKCCERCLKVCQVHLHDLNVA